MNDDSGDLSINSGDKIQLRKRLRSARRELSVAQQFEAADKLLLRLLEIDAFIQSNRIALYLANDGEIDPSKLIKWCAQNNRQCYLPVVRQEAERNWLIFAEVTPSSQFKQNRFGIQEPVVDQSLWIDARDLDLVLLPLVGFDELGNRIGMGGGFYDTTFEFLKLEKSPCKPRLIGVAHDIQKVEKINAESWDVPLTMVVTDQTIYQLGQ